MTPYLHSLLLLFGAQCLFAVIHLAAGERLVFGPNRLLCWLVGNAAMLALTVQILEST